MTVTIRGLLICLIWVFLQVQLTPPPPPSSQDGMPLGPRSVPCFGPDPGLGQSPSPRPSLTEALGWSLNCFSPAPGEPPPLPPLGLTRTQGSQTRPIIRLPLPRPLLQGQGGWASPQSRGGLFPTPLHTAGRGKEVGVGGSVTPSPREAR